MKNECTRSRDLMKFLRERFGAMTWNFQAGMKTSIGWPDWYVVHWKWIGHLEFKIGRGSLSAAQKQVIKDLRLRGANVEICRHDSLSVEYMTVEDIDGQVLRYDVHHDELLDTLVEIALLRRGA